MQIGILSEAYAPMQKAKTSCTLVVKMLPTWICDDHEGCQAVIKMVKPLSVGKVTEDKLLSLTAGIFYVTIKITLA